MIMAVDVDEAGVDDFPWLMDASGAIALSNDAGNSGRSGLPPEGEWNPVCASLLTRHITSLVRGTAALLALDAEG